MIQIKNSKMKTPLHWIFVFWLLAFTLVPFLFIFVMSFLSRNELGSVLFSPSIESYLRCLDWIYFKALTKTLTMAITGTFLTLIICFPIASFLAGLKGSSRQILLTLLFIPFWISFILRLYGIISILGHEGLLNTVALQLGLIQNPLNILYSKTAVYLGLVYNYLPLMVVPVYASLSKFDTSLREAALDLGASPFQVFWKVLIPNIRGGIIVGCFFVFIPMLGEYLIPDLLGGAKEAYLGNIMVSQFLTVHDWPFGSALASLLAGAMLLALGIQAKFRDEPVTHE